MRRMVIVAFVIALSVVPAGEARDSVDTTYAGQTEQGLAGYVRVLPHRAGVQAVFTYSIGCSASGTSILWTRVAKVPVRGGKFHYTRKEDKKGPKITLDGKVTPANVTGTWHVHYTEKDAFGTVRDTCDSGNIDWTLPRDGAGGQITDGYPIVLRLNRTTVRTLELVTVVNCESGNSYAIPTFYENFPIAKDGSFHKSFTDDGTPVGNRTSKLTIDFQGQVKNGRVQGTWKLGVVFSQSGKQVDNCSSKVLKWSATT